MKKSMLKVVAPSVAALVMSASVAAGATYALFTSNAKTNIAITAGKVNLDVTIDSDHIQLYSGIAKAYRTTEAIEEDDLGGYVTMEDEYGAEYYSQVMSGLTFKEGGTATWNGAGKTLDLKYVIPGDKAKVNVKFDNQSNVRTLYRYGVEYVTPSGESEANAKLLFASLDFDMSQGEGAEKVNFEFDHMIKYVSEWKTLEAFENVPDLNVSVLMPMDAGNKLQTLMTSVRFTVEAVQGNAYVADGQTLISYNPVTTDEQGKTEDQVLEVGQTLSSGNVVASIPASAIDATTTKSDALSLNVVEENEPSEELQQKFVDPTAGQFVIDTDAEEILTYDISVTNQNNEKLKAVEEGKPILVTVYVGTTYRVQGVYHTHGDPAVVTAMTRVDVTSVADLQANEYYQDNFGYVYFKTVDFSSFSVKYIALPEAEVTELEGEELPEAGYNAIRFAAKDGRDNLANLLDYAADYDETKVSPEVKAALAVVVTEYAKMEEEIALLEGDAKAAKIKECNQLINNDVATKAKIDVNANTVQYGKGIKALQAMVVDGVITLDIYNEITDAQKPLVNSFGAQMFMDFLAGDGELDTELQQAMAESVMARVRDYDTWVCDFEMEVKTAKQVTSADFNMQGRFSGAREMIGCNVLGFSAQEIGEMYIPYPMHKVPAQELVEGKYVCDFKVVSNYFPVELPYIFIRTIGAFDCAFLLDNGNGNWTEGDTVALKLCIYKDNTAEGRYVLTTATYTVQQDLTLKLTSVQNIGD